MRHRIPVLSQAFTYIIDAGLIDILNRLSTIMIYNFWFLCKIIQ